MTSIEQIRYKPWLYLFLARFAQIFNWWVEHRRYRRFCKATANLTDHQLRDIGLEHHVHSNRDLIISNSRYITFNRFQP